MSTNQNSKPAPRPAQGAAYRRRIKKTIQMVKTYRLMTTGSDLLTKDEVAGLGFLGEPMILENERRVRSTSFSPASIGL